MKKRKGPQGKAKATAKPKATKPKAAKSKARKPKATKPKARKPKAKAVDTTGALVAAIQADRLDDVRALLAAGADPDALDRNEEQPPLFFALDGHPRLVPVLLDAGADPNTPSSMGWTPLMFACAGVPDPEVVELLLRRGADARTTDGDGTALTRALESAELTGQALTSGVERVVRALLAAGADPGQARDDGWTPLMLAAHAGSVDAVTALLEAGAPVDAAKGEGEERVDAVEIAEHRGHAAIVDLLRRRGAVDPAARAEALVREAWEGVLAWLRAHAPASLARLVPAGAGDEEVARLEAGLGAALPADLRAHLRLHGRSRGLPWREYEVLGVEAILGTWRGLKELQDDGTFACGREPLELDPDQRAIRPVWWSPGLVPFAQDGCGNQYCVDLDPGERGARGQVVAWEVQSGPVGPLADSFLEYLGAYRRQLESGGLEYDPESGTFPERRGR